MKRMDAATNYPALVTLTSRYSEGLRAQYGVDFRNFHHSSRFVGVNRGWHDATHVDPVNIKSRARARGGRS